MNIEQIVLKLLSLDKPILFSDTCSLLNVYEVFHQNLKQDFFIHYQNVLGLVNDKILVSVLPFQVCIEFNRHLKKKHIELSNDLKYLADKTNKYLSENDQGKLDKSFVRLRNGIDNDAHKLIDLSFIAEANEDLISRANIRNNNGQAPAHRARGKDSNLGDCIITEYLLAISKALREMNFSKSIYFVSSNSKDFGSYNRPVEGLVKEFNEYSIELHNDYKGIKD